MAEAAEFLWSVRVYYEDTDAGGVVYHSNYLNFMERARTEWLRALGFEQHLLRQELGVVFAVSSLQIQFIRPARFDDALLVGSRLAQSGRASLVFAQEVRRDAEVLCRAEVRVASLDVNKFKPVAIPQAILQAIT
ncbi:MAG: tol-pal system-associated acyl-CoA thioesterase [Gammaproteobacteria bacterium]|nr:tol-pal system-associated acyl-CoA thioesterase [Gammaproteobacteria bacterium]